MPVHHKVRPLARALRGGGGDDGMEISGVFLRLETNGAAMVHHPVSRGPHVLGVLGLRGDARQPQVFEQFLLAARAMGAQIVENRLHAHGV